MARGPFPHRDDENFRPRDHRSDARQVWRARLGHHRGCRRVLLPCDDARNGQAPDACAQLEPEGGSREAEGREEPPGRATRRSRKAGVTIDLSRVRPGRGADCHALQSKDRTSGPGRLLFLFQRRSTRPRLHRQEDMARLRSLRREQDDREEPRMDQAGWRARRAQPPGDLVHFRSSFQRYSNWGGNTTMINEQDPNRFYDKDPNRVHYDLATGKPVEQDVQYPERLASPNIDPATGRPYPTLAGGTPPQPTFTDPQNPGQPQAIDPNVGVGRPQQHNPAPPFGGYGLPQRDYQAPAVKGVAPRVHVYEITYHIAYGRHVRPLGQPGPLAFDPNTA